ncbi:MAG: hypothetical protein IPK23_15750 [Rhizobiales bacterium]|nr:hypothetical protein [Hyphomicrobiales bacterium]
MAGSIEKRRMANLPATVLFKHLEGSSRWTEGQMLADIEKLYARLLTRYVRNPRSDKEKPLWVILRDLPVYKRGKKACLTDFQVNGGVHFHPIIAIPPADMCRPGVGLKRLLGQRQEDFFVRGTNISTFHVKRVTGDIDDVVDYALKQLGRGNATRDDLIILPRAVREL